MFAHTLQPSYSNNYYTPPAHGYSDHPVSSSFTINSRARYLDALAEARAAEEQRRAEITTRREDFLQRRMQQLQESAHGQFDAQPFENFYDSVPYNGPSEAHLESLRLQVEEEERELAKLQEVRQKRFELEHEEREKQQREITERLASEQEEREKKQRELTEKLITLRQSNFQAPGSQVTSPTITM